MPSSLHELPRLAYSMAESAHIIGVSRPHLYNLACRGELRTVMVGNRRLVPRSEIERLAGAGTTTDDGSAPRPDTSGEPSRRQGPQSGPRRPRSGRADSAGGAA